MEPFCFLAMRVSRKGMVITDWLIDCAKIDMVILLILTSIVQHCHRCKWLVLIVYFDDDRVFS